MIERHHKFVLLMRFTYFNLPTLSNFFSFLCYFFQGKQKNLSDNMDVASYLLKPVQRLGKYALLIRDLIRECRPTDPELALLKVRLGGVDIG